MGIQASRRLQECFKKGRGILVHLSDLEFPDSLVRLVLSLGSQLRELHYLRPEMVQESGMLLR